MFARWFAKRRRRQILAQPFPPAWEETLRRGVRHYRHLPVEQRERVRQIVPVMLAEKEWAPAGAFQLTEDMRLAIAGQAAVMVSGSPEPFFFDRLQTIVVHDRAIRFTPRQSAGNPHLPASGALEGVAWQFGPVLVSWGAFERERRGFDPGHNVVLHEFAHHLDGLDGHMDGSPPLDTKADEKRWYAVTESEFLRLVGQAHRDEATLLDHYGATNRAEFFAVSTECFFELPHELRERHRGLYDVLLAFYRQDPAMWMPAGQGGAGDGDADVAADERRQTRRQHRPKSQRQPPRRRGRVVGRVRAPRIEDMAAADALFALALDQLSAGEPEEAARVLTQVIAAQPNDEEALAHRAIAHLQLGQSAAALADCEAALAIDAREVDALCVRAELRLDSGDARGAMDDLNTAVAYAPNDAEALVSRAEAWLALGKPRRAIRDTVSALGVDPYYAEAFWQRGLAHEALGRKEKAEQDFTRARLLEPGIDGQ